MLPEAEAALIPAETEELPAILPAATLPFMPWRAAVPASNRAALDELDPGVVTDDPPPSPAAAANPSTPLIAPMPPPLPPPLVSDWSVWAWFWFWFWFVLARPLTRSSIAGTLSSSPGCWGGMATEGVAMVCMCCVERDKSINVVVETQCDNVRISEVR